LQSAFYRGCSNASQKDSYKNILIKAAQEVPVEDLNTILDWGTLNNCSSSVKILLNDESLQNKIDFKSLKKRGAQA